MTHEERVRHHMYDTLEGIAEQSERIASLEELVLDMWASCPVHDDDCAVCPHYDGLLCDLYRRMEKLVVAE